MKIILFLILGFFGLMILLGGMGGVAKDTYPQQVPIAAPANHTPVTTEGDPTLLIICVIAVVGGLFLGSLGGSDK